MVHVPEDLVSWDVEAFNNEPPCARRRIIQLLSFYREIIGHMVGEDPDTWFYNHPFVKADRMVPV